MIRATAALALLFPLLGLTPRQELKVEVLDKLKSATVYVIVNDGGMTGTGSGFLFLKRGSTGYIMTCEHVVGGARTVKVVFWSGTAQEKSYTAKVVATDPERDIACLIVREIPGMPVPLELGKKTVVRETETVFAAGFPFGAQLADGNKNPEISISRSSVSSLRRNEAGDLSRVQVSGEINPGNSGGPLVSGDGRVIGVTSSKIRGTQTAFAVPSEEVQDFLRGRVKAATFRKLEGSPTKAKYEVILDLVDPLATLKSVGVAYIDEKELKTEPKMEKEGGWKKIHPSMKSVSLKIDEERAANTVEFVAEKAGAALIIQFQCFYTRSDGMNIWTEPAPQVIYFSAGPDPAGGARRGPGRGPPPPDEPEPPPVPGPAVGPLVELTLPESPSFVAELPTPSAYGGLHLAPDGSALYALDLSEGQVYKLDPDKLTVTARVDAIESAVSMAMTPDGKTLYVGGRLSGPFDPRAAADRPGGALQVIDTQTFTTTSTIPLKAAVVELVAMDRGMVAATCHGTFVGLILVDVPKKIEEEVRLHSYGATLRLLWDQRRLYLGDVGISPGDFRCLPLWKVQGQYASYDSPYHGDYPLGGSFELSPDGKYLVGALGSVLRLARAKEADLRYMLSIDPFQAAAMAPGSSTLFTFNAERAVKAYSLESFELKKTQILEMRCVQAILDVKRRRIHGVFTRPVEARDMRFPKARVVEAGKLASIPVGGP